MMDLPFPRFPHFINLTFCQDDFATIATEILGFCDFKYLLLSHLATSICFQVFAFVALSFTLV